MKRFLKKLGIKFRPKHRRGGISMVEVVVCMTVISIGSVAAARGFYMGHEQLRRQRNKMRAISLLKGEAEYWLGRIHISPLTPFERQNGKNNPDVGRRPGIMIDDRGTPYEESDDIVVDYLGLVPGGAKPMDIFDTPVNPDWWEVTVEIRYTEAAINGRVPEETVIALQVPFIPSSI